MASCRATRNICFLVTTHGHLPSSSSKKLFSPDDAGFNYLSLKASGSKYMQLCRNHAHILRIDTANTWLRACAHDVVCWVGWGGGAEVGEIANRQTNPSKNMLIQTVLWLIYTKWKQKLQRVGRAHFLDVSLTDIYPARAWLKDDPVWTCPQASVV